MFKLVYKCFHNYLFFKLKIRNNLTKLLRIKNFLTLTNKNKKKYLKYSKNKKFYERKKLKNFKKISFGEYPYFLFLNFNYFYVIFKNFLIIYTIKNKIYLMVSRRQLLVFITRETPHIKRTVKLKDLC